MDDPETTLKHFIEMALTDCHDCEFLDLIYTLIVTNNEGK